MIKGTRAQASDVARYPRDDRSKKKQETGKANQEVMKLTRQTHGNQTGKNGGK